MTFCGSATNPKGTSDGTAMSRRDTWVPLTNTSWPRIGTARSSTSRSAEALPLPQLEGPRLDTDRLGVRRGLRQSVDDAAPHTATPQLDGDRQPDRPRTDDEHPHVCTAVAGECSSGR